MLYYREDQINHYNTHKKYIKTINISLELMNCLRTYHMPKYQVVSFDEFKLLYHGLAVKNCQYLYVDPNHNDSYEPYKMIFNFHGAAYSFLYDMEHHHVDQALIDELNSLLTKYGKYHYDYCFVCPKHRGDAATVSPAIDGLSTIIKSKIWLKKVITAHFTHDTLEQFVKEHGDNHLVEPLRKRYEEDELIHKWDDCTYMDIHKAHASELLKMFAGTGIDTAVQVKLNQGVVYKKAGDMVKYQETKDIINYAVGMLGLIKKDDSGAKIAAEPDMWLLGCNTRPLYNRIVNNIRAKIDKQRELMSGDNLEGGCIYAQTDGLIIQHSNEVPSSNKVGEFGLVFKGTVYTYHCNNGDGHTSYTIYQYTDESGVKHVKGDLPDELKQYIDLEKGKVVVYKKNFITSADGCKTAENTLIAQKEVKINEEK